MKGPLESTKYFVLLALAGSSMAGSDIRRQIIGDTMGTYISDGTLYAALKSMVRTGLIEGGDTGRHYGLTEKGRRILTLEVKTHKRAAELGRERLNLRP